MRSARPSRPTRRIAFQQYDGTQTDIWIMNADGGGQLNLTSAPVGEVRPAFSPDGRTIAFTRFDGTQLDIWVMNADGGGQRNLTNTPSLDEFDPDFSADGRKIVFSGFAAGQSDISTMNADGSGRTPLTSTAMPVNELDPDWESIQRCGKRRATIVGDDGPDKIKGTKRKDVIDANATSDGKNKVKGRGGNDTICVGKGKAKVNCGPGERDKVIGRGKGRKKETGCERTKGKGFK